MEYLNLRDYIFANFIFNHDEYPYPRHHVEFHGHSNDIEPNHGGNGQIEVFARDHFVHDHP